MILISDGAELILINRKSFLETLTGDSTLNLKFKMPPYPNDENFILKYFSFLQWERFRERLKKKTLDKKKEKEKILNNNEK